MKYLKEYYIEGNISTFREIHSSQLDSHITVPFSESDIETIKQTVGNIKVEYNSNSKSGYHSIQFVEKTPHWGYPIMFQKPDEWFYIFCIAPYLGKSKVFAWECDQIEGVVDCLKFLIRR